MRRHILNIKGHELRLMRCGLHRTVPDLKVAVLVGKDVFAVLPPDRINDDARPDILEIRSLLRLGAGILLHSVVAPLDAPVVREDNHRLRQFLRRIIHHLADIFHDIAAIALKAPRTIRTAFTGKGSQRQPNHAGNRGDISVIIGKHPDQHQHNDQMDGQIHPGRKIARHRASPHFLFRSPKRRR